jgi:hypothetical protein
MHLRRPARCLGCAGQSPAPSFHPDSGAPAEAESAVAAAACGPAAAVLQASSCEPAGGA